MLALTHLFSVGASLTAGAHTLSGRAFEVSLPNSGSGHVLILLHGLGGTGAPMLRSVARGMPELSATHILVAPDGPSNSWNIVGEPSNEDDQV